jgi:hypothetical protein
LSTTLPQLNRQQSIDGRDVALRESRPYSVHTSGAAQLRRLAFVSIALRCNARKALPQNFDFATEASRLEGDAEWPDRSTHYP